MLFGNVIDLMHELLRNSVTPCSCHVLLCFIDSVQHWLGVNKIVLIRYIEGQKTDVYEFKSFLALSQQAKRPDTGYALQQSSLYSLRWRQHATLLSNWYTWKELHRSHVFVHIILTCSTISVVTVLSQNSGVVPLVICTINH